VLVITQLKKVVAQQQVNVWLLRAFYILKCLYGTRALTGRQKCLAPYERVKHSLVLVEKREEKRERFKLLF
jgi:hypothetical protein